MKILVAVAAVVLIHGSYATLLIRGPTEPVLEGDPVVLECLTLDSDLNISQVHFEIFSKYMQRWYKVWEKPWERSFCYYRLRVLRSPETLLLSIPNAGRYNEGPYRCVSDADNVTSPGNMSETLSFKVHYMGELSLSREGYTRYLRVPEELRVRAGDDVVLKCSASSSEEPSYYWQKEGDDWILPSSQLTLRKVNEMNEGQYTCMAQHPSMASLSKKRTISIAVLPKDAPWHETSNGRLVLMTSAAAAAALLVFILFVSILQRCRAKKIKTSKGPIDDRSQKKPIYKASVESLPSTSGDQQPLV